MTTLQPNTLEQTLYFTPREDVDTATIVFTKEGQTASFNVSATVTKQGYYQTATLTIDPALEEGSNYLIAVNNLEGTELYKGTVLATNQTTENYSINNGDFTTTTTSGNDFILF